MSAVGASGYAAINARVRVMYSSLLGSMDYARLAETPDFSALIGQMAHSPYGPFIEQAREKSLSPRRAAYQLRGRLAEIYRSFIQAAPGHARPLLLQLFRHFEINNLKAILRGIAANASWDQVRFLLFPLGQTSVLRAQEMMEAGSLTGAVELLRGTPYYETVSHAMKRYTTEQSIFTLEVAIDLDYWRRLWKEVKGLPGPDRIPAQKVLGALVDMNNLMWAIRYQTFHHLTEEELINYTLPFGQNVHDDDIRAIASGADYVQVAARIYPGLSRTQLFSEAPENRLKELERALQIQLIEQCRAAFVGDSFHIGTLLAYLILCEMEIQDLTLFIEAKAQQIPSREFQRYQLLYRPETNNQAGTGDYH